MISSFFERLYFNPRWYDWSIISLLLPLSLLYGLVAFFRRVSTKRVLYPVPIISIGNLIVGGSGKSPFLISLAKYLDSRGYKSISVISRGYGRESSGLVEVSRDGEILTDVSASGDEPMLIAKALRDININVIVSKNRHLAIKKALKNGAKLILLDDGFSRVDIEKFEILLFPKRVKNPLPFPAGGFREPLFSKRFANLCLSEDRDFFREVKISDATEKMILATAIANPKRLDRWLDERVVYKYYLRDHSWFDEDKLKELLERFGATSILTTEKDLVKMEGFDIPISVLKLNMRIDSNILERVENYLKDFNAEEYRDS